MNDKKFQVGYIEQVRDLYPDAVCEEDFDRVMNKVWYTVWNISRNNAKENTGGRRGLLGMRRSKEDAWADAAKTVVRINGTY